RRRQICQRSIASGLRRNRFYIGAPFRCARQALDLAGELVTTSSDGSDQVALRTQGGAQSGNLGLEIILPDAAAGPPARHQRVLAEDGSGCLDQRHQHVESAPTKPCPTAIDQQFPAMRQYPETPECDAR